MRFVGIDVGAERHVVAAVDVAQAVVLKPTGFAEDAGGYQQMLTLLGPATDTLVAMEATGHYWKNLFAVLVTQGFVVALLNPLRTHRFAAEELQRTKTDAIDALGIARFAAQKRPAASRLPDAATEELRERLRYRDRLSQDFGDRERQLHRLLDLGFPEFPRYVRDVGSELATTILRHYPTAAAFQGVPVRRVAGLRYAHDQPVGRTVATALLTAAATSVGQHHSAAYRLQVQDICEDLDVLRRRLRTLDRDIERLLERHEIGTLLTTIDGIGPQTAARLVATFGDFRGIRSGAALASYVGAIPGLRQSGKHLRARLPHPARCGAPARQALHARPQRGPLQPVAPRLLRGAHCTRQAAQGRAHCGDAQIAPCRVQRRHPSPALCAARAGSGGASVKKLLAGHHGI
jgi:transposase